MEYIENWLRYLEAGQASPRSIYLRRTQLLALARECGDPLALSESQLVEYLAGHEWRPATRRSVRGALSSFYAWAHRTNLLDDNPAADLPTIRVHPGVPKPVPEAVLAAALEVADDQTRFMLLLAAYGGLRREEISKVHERDISDVVLTVHGKGDKDRNVPIHPRLAPYLRQVRGWAFPSPVRPGEPVTHDYIHDRVTAVLPAPWTTHSLRHRFATQAMRACRDVTVVQQLLGHTKVETTLRYILVDQDELQAAVLAVA